MSSNVQVLKPPRSLSEIKYPDKTIFLAGTIDMGASIDWQSEFAKSKVLKRCTLLNPRRDSWNPEWEQTIHNDHFRGQVEWELDGMERSQIVVFFFAGTSKSPITLLELGLNASSRPSSQIICCCEPEFYRRGNIEVICDRYGILLLENLDQMLLETGKRLQPHQGQLQLQRMNHNAACALVALFSVIHWLSMSSS